MSVKCEILVHMTIFPYSLVLMYFTMLAYLTACGMKMQWQNTVNSGGMYSG